MPHVLRVLLVLASLGSSVAMTGCGSTAEKVIVVTATPRPDSNSGAASSAGSDVPTSTPSMDPHSLAIRAFQKWESSGAIYRQPDYAKVNDHPDEYFGNYVLWPCEIVNFLGKDPSDASHTDIACNKMEPVPNTNIDSTKMASAGEVILNVDASIDTTQFNSGDCVLISAKVDHPAQGTNAFGGTVTNPQLDVIEMTNGAAANGLPSSCGS